jgi:plasmid stability protein
MQDKQKVTLYLPPGIHRQLKIRAAIDEDSMSALVEKAVGFYLKHPDKVEEVEAAAYGKTHQVHVCPECEAALVMRDGNMVSLKNQPSVLTDDFSLDVRETVPANAEVPGEEALVPC